MVASNQWQLGGHQHQSTRPKRSSKSNPHIFYILKVTIFLGIHSTHDGGDQLFDECPAGHPLEFKYGKILITGATYFKI